MFGSGSTAGKIDAFESRLTRAHNGHFLIAPNGKEAWPISAEEDAEFRLLYRDRMERARWLRRIALVAVIPLTIALGSTRPEEPRWLKDLFLALQLFTMFVLPLLAFAQHRIISDITLAGIHRKLRHRITTRFETAVTPVATPLGRFAKRALIGAGIAELVIQLGHALGPRAEFAAYMRVLHGLTVGNESLLAHFTGNLSFLLHLVIAGAIVLMIVDRRSRRAVSAAAAGGMEDESGRGGMPLRK